MNFVVKEYSNEDRLMEYENLYLQFKDLWLNTNLNKYDCCRKIGVTNSASAVVKYINKRLAEDKLPLCRKSYAKKEVLEQIYDEPVEKIQEYELLYQNVKKEFLSSTKKFTDILHENKIFSSHTKRYKYVYNRLGEDGLSPRIRRARLSQLRKLKQSGFNSFDEAYECFKKKYLETTEPVSVICKQFGMYTYNYDSSLYQYFLSRLDFDGLPFPNERRMIISDGEWL